MGQTGDKGRLEDHGQLQINDDDDRQDDDHSNDDRHDDDLGNDDGGDDEEKDLDDIDSVGEMLNVQTCSIHQTKAFTQGVISRKESLCHYVISSH